MKFHVVNLGCKVNRVESDAFSARLLEKGWLASDKQDADLVIINTCTVTGEAEKKTRKAIRRALRDNPRGRIVVTGCAAVIDAQGISEIDKRVIVETDKTKIDAAIAADSFESQVQVFEMYGDEDSCTGHFSAYDAQGTLRTGTGFVSRVGMKIQDGCNNACTFCIVHKARGKAWSRQRESILAEAMAYEEAGVRELVLTGINIGSYKSDEGTLVDLLDALLEQTSELRFRISSIEPRDVDDELISLISSAQGRICRHFHLPMQSGSDAVLRAMARPYDSEYYRRLVESIYECIPSMSLSTDLIVGFPGETECDFEDSFKLATDCRFSKMHIFPYSMRKGTPAAARTDQVDSATKADRLDRMHTRAQSMRQEDLQRRRGTIEYVLVEDGGFGTTESYHKVAVPASAKAGDVLRYEL